MVMHAVRLSVRTHSLPMSKPFVIHGYVFRSLPVVRVTLTDGHFTGRGEAAGVYYFGETPDDMMRTILSVQEDIERGISRVELRNLLPPGGARNAVDAALWELESFTNGTPIRALAGTDAKPLVTTFTIGADTPMVMASDARKYAQAVALKLKLTGELDLDASRIRAVRAERPNVWMGVDANQGYDRHTLPALFPHLLDTGVALLEQPCKRGCEEELDGLQCPIPMAADETVQHLGELDAIVGRFNVVNIKLDKCGGLTEGLLIAQRARELGLRVMVGNMGGSSLAMAPGFVLGQLCDVVDLDGPMFLTEDVSPHVTYENGMIHCADDIWGSAAC